MRILKPEGVEIEFDDKKRHLLFNINVIDDVQEKYDAYIVDVLNSLFDVENSKNRRDAYGKLVYVLASLLNEDVRLHNKRNPNDQWEEITEDFIKSDLVTNGNSSAFAIMILKSFNGSLPQNEEDDPNPKSETAVK